ncbi:hypothetical protein AKJ40_02045 [candidate division MSBL1 archaeon SCGC-AAA259M10]|uniref:ABC transporter domain-containing protein n=1 Tax=candidate division MSBL1 archaeon SCGC-AAA259M10 TaxID=1698270 RepID=A0A133V0P3_9EURY|nr:hypothetical protein AKJ40_02045 [candidate division MSBL1 archaeon SCGC-AAA259M10]
MSEELLRAEDIVSGYTRDLDIIKGASISVSEGQLTALIGPNGCGKSTFLKTILGYIKPRQGKIWFKGEDITETDPYELVESGISYIPQGRTVFRNMSVEENLDMGLWPMRGESKKKKEAIETVYEMFPFLAERKKDSADHLSGGQRQMLSLARAVALQPDLLMLDEPSLGLAPSLVDEVFEHIRNVNEQGITVLVIEQKAAEILKVADYGYVLDEGELAFSDAAEDLLENDEVKKLYLGG